MPETKLNVSVEELATWLPSRNADARRNLSIEEARVQARRMLATEALYEAARELLRVDDDWHGSINSEMAHARGLVRAALALADGPVLAAMRSERKQ